MKICLLLLVSVFALLGCTTRNETTEQPNNLVDVKNSTIREVDKKTGQEISRNLVNLATNIPNVNDATAVVIGPYAIVGIDVDKNLDRSEVGSIKYSVAESIKNDPHGARTIVVADPDTIARLREIREDIQNGEPIQGILNELADIAGRLIPEVPADIIDPNQKNETENQKNKLNQSEKQNLEKQQEDQSNNHK